jgi:hypothetical protein
MAGFDTGYFWMTGGDAARVIQYMIHDPILDQFLFDTHAVAIEPPRISVPNMEIVIPRQGDSKDTPAPLNSVRIDLQRLVEPLTYDAKSRIAIVIHLTAPNDLIPSFDIPEATIQRYGNPGIEVAIYGDPKNILESGERGYFGIATGGYYKGSGDLEIAMGRFEEEIKPRLVKAFPKKTLPKPSRA